MNLDDTTIGVTGAGGFIGLALVERALEVTDDVRGLDASEENAALAREAGAEVVVGDVRDAEAVEEFADGCDVVLHTAAIVGEGGDMERYRSVNVEGTRQVASTAVDCGVKRFLQLSSVMVYGFDFPPEVDEEGPTCGEDNAYCQTKLESERVARDFHGEGDLEVVAVRPGDVYGPRSVPWVIRPLEMMKMHLFVLPDGGRGKIDPTYIDNLVDAIFLLLEGDHTGEVFNVTDGLASETREFFGYHARMLGRNGVPSFPSALLRPAFATIEKACRLVGLEPPATADALNFINKPHGYSNQKILGVGHEPKVGLEEGMKEVEEWARGEGLL